MPRGGAPTTFLRDIRKVVDGGPSPAMTQWNCPCVSAKDVWYERAKADAGRYDTGTPPQPGGIMRPRSIKARHGVWRLAEAASAGCTGCGRGRDELPRYADEAN